MMAYLKSIVALALVLLAAGTWAQDLPQSRWLPLMPDNMDFAIALPDLAPLETELEGLALHPSLTGGFAFATFRDLLLSGAAEDEKPETFTAYLTSAGIDASQGAGIFYEIGSKAFGAVMATTDRDAAAMKLGAIGVGQTVDLGLENAGANFMPDAKLGYFFHEDRVYLASTVELMKAFAASAATAPDPLINELAPSIAPDAILVSLNLATLTGDELATDESAPAMQGLLDAWQKKVDGVFVTINLADEQTQIRVLSHERPYSPPASQTPAAAEASARAREEERALAESKRAPMAMMPFIPNDVIAAVNLRLTPGLKVVLEQVIRAVVADPAQSAQIVGGVNIAFNMLGDEIALALTDYTTAPEFMLLAPTSSVQQIKGFLPMAGLKEPLLNEGGIDLFGVPDFPSAGETLYVAPATQMLLVGNNLDAIKVILAAGEQPPAGTHGQAIPEELWEQANDGYLHVQGDRVAQLLNKLAPQIVTDPGVVLGDLSVALRTEGAWSEIRVAVPDLGPLTEEVSTAIQTKNQEAALTESREHLAGLLQAAEGFAAEHSGVYPPLSETPGLLMMSEKSVRPSHLQNLWLLVNPGAADVEAAEARLRETQSIHDLHYIYFSHALWDEASGLAFADQYRKRIEEGQSLDGDWDGEGGVTLFRLDQSVVEDLTAAIASTSAASEVASATPEEGAEVAEAAPETDAAATSDIAPAQIPVFMERPGVWEHGRIHVVYLDGHVQPVLPGTFPNTEAFLQALQALDALEAEPAAESTEAEEVEATEEPVVEEAAAPVEDAEAAPEETASPVE